MEVKIELRLAREALGWSQDRAVAELHTLARRRGRVLTQHLKTQLSRWENGHVNPGRDYRELLCEAYERTEEELGLLPLDDPLPGLPMEMINHLASARSAGVETAIAYLEQLDRIRALDRRLGAPTALGQLRVLAKSISDVLAYSVRPAARAPLAAVLADATSLAGWQAIDLGDLEQAWRHHERSKAAAREADDIPGLAHAMGQQAYVLVELGCLTDAAALLEAAQDVARRRVPAVLDAWLFAVEAEVRGVAGHELLARKALDRATAIVLERSDPELPYISLDSAHLARWRGNILAGLGDQEATADLFVARRSMDPTFIRAMGSLECDIARAMIAQRERTAALRHAARPRELARRTGSVRQRRRVEALPLAA